MIKDIGIVTLMILKILAVISLFYTVFLLGEINQLRKNIKFLKELNDKLEKNKLINSLGEK